MPLAIQTAGLEALQKHWDFLQRPCAVLDTDTNANTYSLLIVYLCYTMLYYTILY